MNEDIYESKVSDVDVFYTKIMDLYRVFESGGKQNKRRLVFEPPSVDQHVVGFFDVANQLGNYGSIKFLRINKDNHFKL